MASNDLKVETNALNLRWAFGFNSSIPNLVYSLSTPKRNALFYVSSHTGVIHDTENDQQYLLQGHCNPITAVCVSADKRWIATADSGEEAMIIVWDAQKAVPVKIIPHPYQNGVAAMDMSADSMFLVTLSQGFPQHIAVWEWTVATKEPAIFANIGDHEYQHSVRFNPVDVRDIASNGQKTVIFWNWTQSKLAAFHPPRGIRKLKKSIGLLTETIFIPYTTKAVTATSSGHVVLWDYPVSELVQSSGRDAIKILKICAKTGINLINSVLDRYIVCGCQDGAVRFFDFQFRVVAWFEDIATASAVSGEVGEVVSVSFAQNVLPQTAPSTTGNVSMDDFEVPNFVVATADGKIVELESKSMDYVKDERRKGRKLVQGFDGDVVALDAHPSLPLFAVGTDQGTLQIWDIDDRIVTASRKFELKTEGVSLIRCVKFGPRGDVLAVGFANGTLKLVSAQDASSSLNHGLNITPNTSHSQSLPDISTFKQSAGAIFDISFSPDGQYLATADEDRCVGLYRFFHRDEEQDKAMEWIFVGKNNAHYNPITSIYFERGKVDLEAIEREEKELLRREQEKDGNNNQMRAKDAKTIKNSLALSEKANTSVSRLFSLGEDRVLQEYNIQDSSIRAGLQLLDTSNVDQVAVPTSFVSIPGERRRVKRRAPGADSSSSASSSSSNSDSDVNGGDGEYIYEYTPDVVITANDEYKLKIWDLSSPAATEEASLRKKQRLEVLEQRRLKQKARREAEVGAGDEEVDDDDLDDVDEKMMEEINNGAVEKICVKTLLAPTYGGPINKLFVLPKREGKKIVSSQYLVYSTDEKVVGLIKLPLDGNPNKAMALIAHPARISAIACSFDGRYVITAGGTKGDRSVNLWMVSTAALDANIQLGGQGIEPYMGLIEGGVKGEFYQDMLDYFYYAQLRSQGVLTTKPRQITGFIPVDQVINLMRALGYFPTEQQVRDIKTEIKFSHLGQVENLRDKVDLEEFIKLYVNYRPVFGLGKDQFSEVFKLLSTVDSSSSSSLSSENSSSGTSSKSKASLSRDELLSKISSLGEVMSDDELIKCFETLISTPDNQQELNMKGPLNMLPDHVTPQSFAQLILGFEDYDADK